MEPVVRIDPCSYESAKYAVMHWHYSRRMPRGKLAHYGVWENGKFIGAVIFGYGAVQNIGKPYGLKQREVLELVRVALNTHSATVTQIVSITLRRLRQAWPGLRLVVSYADSAQGHSGTIYQAGNWIYVGETSCAMMSVLGKVEHGRTISNRYRTRSIKWIKEHVDPNAAYVDVLPKYKYLMPLDRAMRRQIEPLRKPYPKREPERRADGNPPTAGGANPTLPLQLR